MPTLPVTSDIGDWFKPTRGRFFVAVLLATIGFLLPQEVPLEWYPLNEPGTDINYLEISCTADKKGEVKIYYDLTRGMNELDSIRFPISPTQQTYTYTFPLPDAPIVDLRVSPLSQGGTLNIRQMRIINRRGDEIRRFTRDMFRSEREVEAIIPSAEGWKLTSVVNSANPSAYIEILSPIIPVGKDHRNLLRCLLSTGYLSMMLWILLLTVLFTFYRPNGWRDLFGPLGFMICLAILFAFVGNRGLIRNSVHYARYRPLPTKSGLSLEFDVLNGSPGTARLFFDTGKGYNEIESVRQKFEPHQGLQTLRFLIPGKVLHALRFDPREDEGHLDIRGIRIVDAGQNTRAVLPLSSLKPDQPAEIKTENSQLHLYKSPGRNAPLRLFSVDAIGMINQAIAQGKPADP